MRITTTLKNLTPSQVDLVLTLAMQNVRALDQIGAPIKRYRSAFQVIETLRDLYPDHDRSAAIEAAASS